MKIESIIKKEELELIIPHLKKLIITNTRDEQLKFCIYVILVTPLSLWLVFIALQNLFKNNFHSLPYIIILFLNLFLLFISLIIFLSLLFYPTFIKNISIQDTKYKIECNDFYRNNIKMVVITKDYIFVYFFPNIIKEKYFIIKNINDEFEQVKRFLVPTDGEKVKYKYIIESTSNKSDSKKGEESACTKH